MANDNYLDALDTMLGPLSDNNRVPSSSATIQSLDESHQASITWAEVIERASDSLQESAHNVQEAARKNIELGKQQHDSIKDLVDAASGWRHTTRQAIQEVTTAKKHVVVLTVISALIAVVGFGTTIGIMLQSRVGLANMSNAILENVDDHQTLLSKTLTVKMDELTSTIEMLDNKLSGTPKEVTTAGNDTPTLPNVAENSALDTVKANNEAIKQLQIQLTTITTLLEKQATQTPTLAQNNLPATTSAVQTAVSAIQPEDVAAEVTASTQPALKAINEKMATLATQLAQFEQRWTQLETSTQKQLQILPTAIDEKLGSRLPSKPTATATTPNAVSSDNKAVLDQLAKLRAEMAELRQMQSSVKDQLGQLKQQREPVPYQYRNPDVERYPH